MQKVIDFLNNRYLIAVVVFLFLLSILKMFSRRG